MARSYKYRSPVPEEWLVPSMSPLEAARELLALPVSDGWRVMSTAVQLAGLVAGEFCLLFVDKPLSLSVEPLAEPPVGFRHRFFFDGVSVHTSVVNRLVDMCVVLAMSDRLHRLIHPAVTGSRVPPDGGSVRPVSTCQVLLCEESGQ